MSCTTNSIRPAPSGPMAGTAPGHYIASMVRAPLPGAPCGRRWEADESALEIRLDGLLAVCRRDHEPLVVEREREQSVHVLRVLFGHANGFERLDIRAVVHLHAPVVAPERDKFLH